MRFSNNNPSKTSIYQYAFMIFQGISNRTNPKSMKSYQIRVVSTSLVFFSFLVFLFFSCSSSSIDHMQIHIHVAKINVQ